MINKCVRWSWQDFQRVIRKYPTELSSSPAFQLQLGRFYTQYCFRHRMELEMLRERQRREIQIARQRIRQSRAHTAIAFAPTTSGYQPGSNDSSPRAAPPVHLPLIHHQCPRLSNTASTQNSSLSLPASPPANPHIFDVLTSGSSPRESVVSYCCWCCCFLVQILIFCSWFDKVCFILEISPKGGCLYLPRVLRRLFLVVYDNGEVLRGLLLLSGKTQGIVRSYCINPQVPFACRRIQNSAHKWYSKVI